MLYPDWAGAFRTPFGQALQNQIITAHRGRDHVRNALSEIARRQPCNYAVAGVADVLGPMADHAIEMSQVPNLKD
jgi:phosphoribosylcarboxyaminoimidazole (NCAIR) mutase